MAEFKVVIKKKSPLSDYDKINRNRIHYSDQLEPSDRLEASENNCHLPEIQYSARKTSLSQSKSPDLISDVTAGSSNASQNNVPIYCPVCTDLLDDRVKRVYAKRIEGKVFLPFLEKAAYTRGSGRAKIKLCIPCYKHLVAQWKNYNLTEVPHHERDYKDRNGDIITSEIGYMEAPKTNSGGGKHVSVEQSKELSEFEYIPLDRENNIQENHVTLPQYLKPQPQRRNFLAPTLVEQEYQGQEELRQNFPAVNNFQQPRSRKISIESHISDEQFSSRRINLPSNSPRPNYNRSQKLAEDPYERDRRLVEDPYEREMTDRRFKDLLNDIHAHIEQVEINTSMNLQKTKNEIEKSIEKHTSQVREELNYLKEDNEYVQYQVTCMRQHINDMKGNQTLLRKRKKKGNFNTMNMRQSKNEPFYT